MVSRQLVSYPATNNIAAQSTPVPDMATFSISPDGLTYTFTIKSGVMWDTPTGPRQVTSQDEVRGLKRLCNPVQSAPPLPYWTNNIAGMKSYCTGFQAIKLPTNPTQEVAALNSYMNGNNISGLSTPNSSTIVITLLHPSSDFINIMALPMSSPVPAEINNYLPPSVELAQHWISDGPYSITAYTPNVSYTLAKNPAWKRAPTRSATSTSTAWTSPWAKRRRLSSSSSRPEPPISNGTPRFRPQTSRGWCRATTRIRRRLLRRHRVHGVQREEPEQQRCTRRRSRSARLFSTA